MRRGLGIAAIVLGVAGAVYCVAGIFLTLTLTMSGVGALIYLTLFIVAVLVALAGLRVVRRDSR